MADLYISYKALEHCLNEQNEDDDLWRLIREKKVDVFIDLELEKLNNLALSQEGPQYTLFSILRAHNVYFSSGYDRMKSVRSEGKLSPLPTTDIYIFDSITEAEIKTISKRYGVLCFSSDNIIFPSASYSKFWDKDSDAKGSWGEIIKGVSNQPCNTIVFLDLYLYKNDKGFNNVLSIIRALCLNVEQQIHILFVWDELASIKNASFVCKKIRESLKNVLVEFVLCSKNNDLLKLHETAHNRKFLANYYIGTAEYTIAAFDYLGSPARMQRLQYSALFSDNDYLYEFNTYVSKLYRDIQYCLNNPTTKGYTYWVWSVEDNNEVQEQELEHLKNSNEVQEQELENLKNRMIMKKLKDGDKCYYLSVPDCNNWMKIEVKTGSYEEKNYKQCVFDKESKPLELIAQKIMNCFKKGYVQASDDNKPFFRVTVDHKSDLKTVHVLQSEKDDLIKNQKQYANNCFAYEKDAEAVVSEIKKILKDSISHQILSRSL
ncbi:MAG: hypothetical protein IKH95_06760 [Bacteroidaceae bacterium]|nr:hypothetical protein [Bacteroidaceae bacterium]